MNPDWTTEQDKEFEEEFDSNGFLGTGITPTEAVLVYIHHREALLIERVVGEITEYCADERDKLGDFNTLNDEYKEGYYMAMNTIMKKYEM